MELTRHYIGDNWRYESFPPMQVCIREFGISASTWISRACMYPIFLAFLFLRHKIWACRVLLVITILYWTSMLSWLEILNIVKF